MENTSGEQPLRTVEEQISYNPDGKVTTTKTTTIHKKEDGSNRLSERVVIKKQGNKISVEESELIGEKQVEAGNNDTRFVEAIEYKGEIAILKGENQLMNIIKLESLNEILKLMGTNLKEFSYDISFGIYSSEEITEFRKSISTKIEHKVDTYTKNYDYIMAPDEKLILPSFFDDEIFDSVQKRVDIILAEREKLKKEKELKLQLEEEERRKKEEEEERIRLEEEERKRKEEEEERERIEEEERIKKEEEEKRKKEEKEKKEKEKEEKKQKELEEQKKKELEIKKRKEEDEKKKKEIEEKKKKDLEKKKEEEEKKKKEIEEHKKEEEAKKKKILEEKKKKDEESKKLKEKELQKKKEEEEKKKEELKKKKEKELQKKKEEDEKKKEELKKKKEEEAKKKKDLENAKKKEEEAKKKKILEEKKKKELEDKKKKEEEAKKKKELEEKKKLKEEEKEKKKKEEEEKKKKELEKRKEQPSPDKNVLREGKPKASKPAKKSLEKPATDYPLKTKPSLEKQSENPDGEKNEEENNDNNEEQKPKKKKKIIKKTITKMVKKKVHKDSEEYLNYLREKERGFKAGGGYFGGGGGGISYAANISRPIVQRCECINCHSSLPSNSGKNLCDRCTNVLRAANNEKELKSLKYYQDDDDKFDTIGTKEFYQLNKDRYMNDLWKEENDKLTKIDEDYNKSKTAGKKNENIEIIESKYLFEKPICTKCGKIQNQKFNKNTYFCKECGGLICGNCSKSHYKENPEHNCNHINIQDKQYWKVPEKLKCSNCNQLSPIDTIYNCNICEGKPICKNCARNHNINNPNHVLKLFGKPDQEYSEKTPTKKPKIKKKEDLLKCPNCGSKDIISNSNMLPCPTCKVTLCDKCQNEHYAKNPNHKLSENTTNILRSDKKAPKLKPKLSDDKIYKKKSGDIPKCSECSKIFGNDIDTINKCNTCQVNLCDNCGNQHKSNNKGHNIIKYPNPKSEKNKVQKFNIGTKCKSCNATLPLGDEECIIVNCIECEGNLCDECCDNHEKNNSPHDLNPIKIIFMENATDFNDSIPKLKCNNCGKNMNDMDNIYYCDECQIDLCNNCGNQHNNDNLEHDLILTKRILIDDNNKGNIKCRQCGKDLGNDDNVYKKCDICKYDLCDACGDNHIDKFPNHNILYTLCKKNYNKNLNDYNYKDLENKLRIPNDKCSNCHKKIYLKNNDIINYCNNCNGNLCSNCNNNHNKKYHDHSRVSPRVIILDKNMDIDDYSKLPIYKCIACDKNLKINLNEPYINCEKCHGNICEECNDTHLQEFPTHKLQLNKYIITDENEDIRYLYDNLPINFECTSCYEKIPLEPETNYCNECKGNICNNCIKLHTKNKKNHKPRILKSYLIEKTNNNIFEVPDISCNSCGTNLSKNINDYIHNCPKCKNILCDNCLPKHNKDYPNHNININKYIFYDIKEQEDQEDNLENRNKPNVLKAAPNDKCSICNKNIRPGNNNQIIHCNKCKGSLCDSCEQNHSSLFPGHDFIIKKYTIDKNIPKSDYDNLISNDKCYNCKRNIPIINDGYIIYCLNCPGNMCNSCGSNHTTKYPDHKIYNFNTIKLEKTKDDLNNKLKNKCGECGNNTNQKTVYNCNKCDKNLCDKCTNSHLKNKYDHNLTFVKYIEEDSYPIDCNVCGRITRNRNGDYENYRCDKCLFNLCEPCGKTHLKKYPNHKLNKAFLSIENEKDREIKNIPNIFLTQNDICNNCKQNLNLKNNDIINYCKNCKGNLCNNCNNNHKKENPSHIITRPYIVFINNKKDINKLPIYKCIACDKKLKYNLNEPYINCDKCHGNICDDCNNTHLKEFPGHNLLLRKYIITGDKKYKNYSKENIPIDLDCSSCNKKISINSDINYCNDCKGNVCDNCIISHNKNNRNHKPRKLNILLLGNDNDNEKVFNIPIIKCNTCGNNLTKNINDYIHNCPKCNVIICDNCLPKHNNDYPEHNLSFDKYLFYETLDENDNNINVLKSVPSDKCYICNKNINIGNNEKVSYCNKCKGNLCDSCEQNHTSLFPGHDFILKKYIINMNPNYNYRNNLDNEIDNINLIRNDNCFICYSDIPINNNDKIIYCQICPGSICKSCNREHNKKFPEHKIYELKSKLNNNYDKNKINKCGECGNKININTIFNCNNCNNNLCNKCANSHLKIIPEHEIIIIKNIYEQPQDKNKYKDYLIKNLNNTCINCNKKLYLKNNDIINYCKNCKGMLCDNCDINHKNIYPEHIKTNPNVILLNKNVVNYNKLPIYKCIACDKNLKPDLNSPYINCDKCHGNICEDCNNTHLKEFPTHNLKLVKYLIDFDDNKNENEINKDYYNDNEEDNLELEDKIMEKPRIKLRNKKLNINLNAKDDNDVNYLEDMGNKDNTINQNENIPKVKAPHDVNCMSCNSKISNFNDCIPCYGYLCTSCKNINKNKFEIVHPQKTSSFSPSTVNCIICNEYLLKDINKPINHCTICKGNLCSNCGLNHLSKYPGHNLHLTKFILTQYIAYDEKYLLNKDMCLECHKNLDKNNSRLVHYCNQCKEKICLDCVEKHNNEYPEHILILAKNLGNFGIFAGKDKTCFCYICKFNHYEAQNRKYYYCNECRNQVCETCKLKHDEKYYSHVVANPHSYEDDKIKK